MPNLISVFPECTDHLTLNGPIEQKSSAFLVCLNGKQCGPRSDCSYMSSLFWAHSVCFYTLFISNVRQLFAADDFSRRHFQMHFFLGALRVNWLLSCTCSTLMTGYLLKIYKLAVRVPASQEPLNIQEVANKQLTSMAWRENTE